MSKPINVEDFRKLAQRRLPRFVFDYLDGGTEDEHGLAHNREVFKRIRFQPVRLRDVGTRDLSTQLFGKSIAAPLVIAPTGLNGLLWPDGDVALATAAAKAGIPFVLSTASNASIEDVARRVDGELWFQLYMVHPLLTDRLIKRALAAGCSTLVVTVDVAVSSNRERDRRNGFEYPLRYQPYLLIEGIAHPRWTLRLLRNGIPHMANLSAAGEENMDVQAALLRREMDAGFDWQGLARIRALWPRRLLVKGVLRAADARRCIAAGTDAVILSNHGGRQLDSCVSPIEVLSDAVAQCDAPILVDSGFRRGSDVVKAIALGATAVLVRRPVLYGLAASGESGVSEVLGIFKREIDQTLAQICCAATTELSHDYLHIKANACDEVPIAPRRAGGRATHEPSSTRLATAGAPARPPF
jgi:(S)-mandelate dehydrogenase